MTFVTSCGAERVRPGAHGRLCGDTPSHPCAVRMWFLIGFHCLDVKLRTRVFVASDRGELLLIPATACCGCVARTRAHKRLWLTDGPVGRGCGFILRVHAQTENVLCIAKWRGSTHSHGRLCGEAHSRHRHAQQASVWRHSVADTKSLVCARP